MGRVVLHPLMLGTVRLGFNSFHSCPKRANRFPVCQFHMLFSPFNRKLFNACRAPSQETAATGHVLLGAALKALNGVPSFAAARPPALLPCLEQQLQNMNSGGLKVARTRMASKYSLCTCTGSSIEAICVPCLPTAQQLAVHAYRVTTHGSAAGIPTSAAVPAGAGSIGTAGSHCQGLHQGVPARRASQGTQQHKLTAMLPCQHFNCFFCIIAGH